MLRPLSDDPSRVSSASTGGEGAARLARLAEECRRLADVFAFHPAITVVPIAGEPPETYQVEFRVRTITLDTEQRKLNYVRGVALMLTLAGDHPHSPPTVHPPEGLFLPNCDGEHVQIDGAWQSGDWLVDLIPKLGELLAYRTYDPESVLNPDALDWHEANIAILPTDKTADFFPTAGGSPKARIAKYAAARIAEVRRVLQSACDRLADGQIDPDAIEDTAAQAKYVLLPLVGGAADPAIAASAKELSAWAEALPGSLPEWHALHDRRAKLLAALRGLEGVASAGNALEQALAQLHAAFTGTPASKPIKAIGQIPPATVLSPLVPRLSASLAEAQQQEEQARHALAEFADFDLSAASPASAASESRGPLGKILADRQAAIAADCENLPTRAGLALEQMADLLRRGRAENSALQRMADWRDYLDQFTLGTSLAREVINQGSAGVQAYMLESFGNAYGPYQFEQAITFGNLQIAIAKEGNTLQVIDSSTGELVGSRSALAISLKLPVNGSEATLTVRATSDCVATAAQLDSARQRTFDTLSRLHETVPDAQSWCGKLLNVLCDPGALAALHAEHRRSAHRWDRLAVDLLLLAPLKDRLATHFLVKRSAATASAMAQKRAAAEKNLAAANERLAAVAARSERDPNTDKLLIPPQLAGTYAQATADRQSAQKELHRIDRRKRAIADYVGKRLMDPSRIGRAEIPAFRRLPVLPADLAEASEHASDSALADAVMALGDQLGMQFPAIVASDPVDLSGRKREKRPADAGEPADGAEAEQALAARPEDGMAHVSTSVEE